MKYIWEEEDIIPGRIVCKPRTDRTKKIDGWNAKWTYKIGFVGGSAEDKYRLICMADGLVSGPKTKMEIAKSLNDDCLIPMPHEWLLETMEYLRGMYDKQ